MLKSFFIKNKNIIEIFLIIISIIFLVIGLFSKDIVKPIYILLGETFFFFGFVFPLFGKGKDKRGFESVENAYKKYNQEVLLPQRATKNSAAYDFFAPDNFTVEPNEIVKIWTDIKSYMQDDEVLLLNVRSSMGGKFMLANTIGVIDSDYYSNGSNDGNIGIFLKNISNETQNINKADRIAQGLFTKYLTIDNDNVKTKRKGGFGSTND